MHKYYEVLRVLHLPFCQGYSPSTDGHLLELCLTAVRFARKKGNIALASRLLHRCSDRAEEEKDNLSHPFRLLNLEGTIGEKWGPELQIEKAKVLKAAGEELKTFKMLTTLLVVE